MKITNRLRGEPAQGARFRRLSRAAGFTLIALIVGVAVAACGSSSKAKTTASTNGSSSRSKFEACLKSHGVSLPSGGHGFSGRGTSTTAGGSAPTGAPGGGGGAPGGGYGGGGFGGGYGGYGHGGGFFGGGNSKDATAFKDCSKDLGTSGFAGRAHAGNFRPQFSTKVLDKFVTCVRKHGYPQMPEPSKTSNGGFFSKSIEKNAKFQKAAKSCESILSSAFHPPSGGSGSPGASTTSTTSQS